ncbi:MFS transporter [Bacillus licheniformis]
MLSVLKNKNFLFLILGRLVTNIGDSMYTVAAMWLVFDLSKSTFYSGLAGFLTMFPTVLQFLTGPIVDKVRLNKVLVWSQLIQAILVLIIPLFYFIGYLNIWIIMMIMPLIVFIEQFTYPAQSAALPKIIKSQDLVKANSLMSFSYQGTDIIFTGIAGIVIASAGAISIYLVDSFTFFVSGAVF